MKKSLLDVLDNKDMRSTAQLADILNTSVEMVEAQLERYEQLGLVKKTVMNASEQCGGSCKKCKGCKQSQNSVAVVFWEKSERGTGI